MQDHSEKDLTLNVKPIGFIRTEMQLKFDAPHQPDRQDEKQSIVELLPEKGYREALSDLQGFDYIWLVWWFHRNPNWRPMVLPPRGSEKRRGVFATRSPHRPNPIGITAVKLIAVSGRKITIGSNDLVDGTPILDIKPYLLSADCFPQATQGWLSQIEEKGKEAPAFSVVFAEPARSQMEWLSERGVDFRSRAVSILERDPSPHRTRRIKKCDDNLFRISCGAWRLFFSVKGTKVKILYAAPGYPLRALKDRSYESIPYREVQLDFLKKWPAS